MSPTKEEQSFERLERMGVVAWEQVLLILPTKYNDYSKVHKVLPANEALYPVSKACYEVTVASAPNRVSSVPPRVSFDVTDGDNKARLTVFGDVWAWNALVIGQRITIEAVIDIWDGKLQVKSPTRLLSGMSVKAHPVYKGKKGANASKTISPEFVYNKTREALLSHIASTVDYIMIHFPSMDEEYLIKRAGIQFKSLSDMLDAIHAPKSIEEGKKGLASARAIAAFEIVFNAQQTMAKKPNPKSVINVHSADIVNLISKFPYKLTEHQTNGIRDIVEDMRRPYPMNRLLSGDVGFGKTEVALIPGIAAQKVGARVVIMCPSMLIVEQWKQKIHGYGKEIPVHVVTGSTKTTKEILSDNPILIGTTALVTRLPKFKYVPDLVIFDEQHKHGKNHKESLVSPITNRLEATATCQPKTAAMVNYGGMDETILNQCPVNKRIVTRLVMPEDKVRLFAHLKQVMETKDGAQIAIVYPNVSTGEGKSSLLSASAMWEEKFPGQVGVLHGGMSDDEKAAIIQKMHNKEIRILCSSVLIETGITLPSLMGLVVINADRFGVSALHQLRGRLARHGGTGYFYMYLNNQEVQEDTMSRLELLVNHTDGFVLAEKDAEMRGYGSISDEDEGQSGVSKSAMFFGLRLMPKDIEAALVKKD